MLNEESRKYFNRAFMLSSSAYSTYTFRTANHVQHLKDYSKINELNNLVEYLKISNASILTKSYFYDFYGEIRPIWVPTFESPNTIGAFMTEVPDELYRTGKAAVMDAVFSFTKEVCYALSLLYVWNCYNFLN